MHILEGPFSATGASKCGPCSVDSTISMCGSDCGRDRKSFQGLLGWQIGHWRSRYRVFDHRGGRRGLRLDPDIIGEAKPTAVRSAADLSAPKRGMWRPAIRSAVNHL